MQENLLAALAILAATAIVLSPVACTVHQQMVISEAIEKGHDPMSAKCATESHSSPSDAAVCMAVVGKRNG